MFRTASIFAAALVLPSLAMATEYQLDSAHTAATFSVRHMMVSNVKGEFSNVKGTISYDPKKPANTTIDATIDTTTINTREPKRDAHLKSPDFFDVEKFPTMTFKSKKATSAGKDKLKVVGDLTMHGVTKEVTLDVSNLTGEVKDPWGNAHVGATATTKLNRKDFGLNWNKALEAGGVLVGDEVQVTIDIEALPVKAPAATADKK
jgi:polyisoprenoid-binding protein YceI